MKHFTQEIILRLLYLTPLGYILSLLALQTGEKTPGVYIDLHRDTPILAHIKQNPLFTDRTQWLLNGISLISQAFFVFHQKLGDIFAAYGWIALVFGVVNLVSAFFPRFKWNERLAIIKVSILEIVVIVLLGVSVMLSSNTLPI